MSAAPQRHDCRQRPADAARVRQCNDSAGRGEELATSGVTKARNESSTARERDRHATRELLGDISAVGKGDEQGAFSAGASHTNPFDVDLPNESPGSPDANVHGKTQSDCDPAAIRGPSRDHQHQLMISGARAGLCREGEESSAPPREHEVCGPQPEPPFDGRSRIGGPPRDVDDDSLRSDVAQLESSRRRSDECEPSRRDGEGHSSALCVRGLGREIGPGRRGHREREHERHDHCAVAV
jgi:hypothetical protein